MEKKDWLGYVLAATMFALRTTPHGATGFAPAELVYDHSLRLPLCILHQSWDIVCVNKRATVVITKEGNRKKLGILLNSRGSSNLIQPSPDKESGGFQR